MDAVTIDGASKHFGDEVALSDVTISVQEGSILGIIGPSGAGKTTLVRLMTGALAPTEGEIRVMGEDPLHFKRRTRERIGYMPQSFALYPDLTARENVDFVASLFGLLWWRRRRRTRQVLELVDLWDVRKTARGPAIGRHAATSRACLGPRARPTDPVPRRADRRDRPAAPRHDLARADVGCATPAGRCW